MATPVPQKDDVEHWTVEQVAAWLQQVKLAECCDIFLRKGIDGHQFLQLTEESLFLWGRDLSIRNRKHILKLVSQIKNVQQHSSTTRPSLDMDHGYNPQGQAAYSDYDYSDDDFSVDGEDYEEEDSSMLPSLMQPPQENNMQDSHAPVNRPPIPVPNERHTPVNWPPIPVPNERHTPVNRPPIPVPNERHTPVNRPPLPAPNGAHAGVRPPFPTPGGQVDVSPANDDMSDIYMRFDDDEDEDDEETYLPPKELPRPPGVPSNKGMFIAGHSPSSPQLPRLSPVKLPFIASKDPHSKLNNTLSGRIPSPAQRGPAPLPEHVPPPPKKYLESQTLPSQGKGSVHNPWKKEPAWTTPKASKDNDHVYESVENPMTSCWVPESHGPSVADWQSSVRPPVPPPFRKQNQDFVDQDLSSRFGAASLKQLPVVRKHSGGNDSGSGSDSPKLHHSKLSTKPVNGSPFNSKTQEIHPNECAPPTPQGNQPYFILDDGKCLMLTPLYQKLMDKPYFHLLSRTKAMNFTMRDRNGAFLIRPSTKSGNPLTLTFKLEDRPYNINIRQRPDSLFALGSEKSQEKAFSSLDELVQTYTMEPIKIDNGKTVYLKHSPAKKGGIYVKHHPPRLANQF